MQRGSEEPLFVSVSEPCSAQQHIKLMTGHTGAQAADRVGDNGAGGEVTIAEGIEHGGVGAQKATPAHPHGGKHRDLVAGHPPLGDKGGRR